MSTDTDNWNTDTLNDQGMGDGFDAFDADGIEPQEDSRPVDKPGFYHFAIQEVTAHPETCKNGNPNQPVSPHLLLICRVLHSVPGQSPEGSVYFHRMYMQGKGGGPAAKGCIQNNTNFLVGVGIMRTVKRTNAEGKEISVGVDAETGSTKVENLTSRLKGLQFVGNIKHVPSDDPQYGDKFELKFGSGAYTVDNPAVADVPKNVEALKEIGITLGNGGDKKPAQAPAQTASAQSASPTETVPSEQEIDLDI